MVSGTAPAQPDEYIVPSYCKLPIIWQFGYPHERYGLETLEAEKLIESGSPVCWAWALITELLCNGKPTISSTCTSQAISEPLFCCGFCLFCLLFFVFKRKGIIRSLREMLLDCNRGNIYLVALIKALKSQDGAALRIPLCPPSLGYTSASPISSFSLFSCLMYWPRSYCLTWSEGFCCGHLKMRQMSQNKVLFFPSAGYRGQPVAFDGDFHPVIALQGQ